MRPVELTMRAFGSYGQLTRIDFRETNQNLFLITGDTGAGKTTIFDAIVFALYGEASSSANKKEGVILQSQYVEMDVEPFVELVFSAYEAGKEQLYTVRRVPRHLKRLTRGSGKNNGTREVTGSVSLILPDGTEYPQKEADGKIGQILGLTKNQFMQVAMIAQGEFMELLRAKSDDKKVIFRKLFNTELYQNIVEELLERKRVLEKEISQIRVVCQTETAHAVIPEGYEEKEILEQLQSQIQKGELVVLESFLCGLQKLCERTKKELVSAQEQMAVLEKQRDEKRDGCTKARQLLQLYEQLEAAMETLKECAEAEVSVKEKQQLADKIQAAYKVKGEFDRYQDCFRRFSETEQAIARLEQEKPGLAEGAAKAAEKAVLAKEAADQELAAYTVVYNKVRKEKELLKELNETKKQEALSLEKLANAEKKAQEARVHMEALEVRNAKWREEEEKLSDARMKLAEWEKQEQAVSGLVVQSKEVLKLRENYSKQQEETKNIRTAYLEVRQAYEKQNEKYEALRRSYLDAQAGFLAQELQLGKPCPVCGSLEHPSPCAGTEIPEGLDRNSLELEQMKNEELRKRQEEYAAAAKSAADLELVKVQLWEDALDKLKKCILESSQGSLLTFSQDFSKEELSACLHSCVTDWWTQLLQEGEERKRAVKTFGALQQALKKAEEEMLQGKKAAEAAGNVYTEALAAASGFAPLLEKIEKSREYPSEAAAMEAYTTARTKNQRTAAFYQEMQEAAQAENKRLHDCEALLLRYRQELPQLRMNCQERLEAYKAALERQQIQETEWKNISDIYTCEQAEELQKQYRMWEQRRIAAQSAEVSAKKVIGDAPRPDMARAQQELQEAEEKRLQAQQYTEQYKEQYRANAAVCTALLPQMEIRGKIIEKHGKLENLYKLLSGNVSGSRMDLETFVQRHYLEKILHAANRRFEQMSAGQFQLRMVDSTNAGKGKNRGLDLMVYSAVTGKEREVRTLSGGESFMAALSLALGLADQIQESSAAIHLDMMFVDEGFGSLDEHSRQQAVRVLQELAGGRKLIGIISHVSELKQEMENQLLVTKDENGSHVKWQIS